MSHLHPTKYKISFADTGVETTLVRCTFENLQESTVGVVSNKDTGESYGSVELVDDQLIINDPKDIHLLYVQNVLSDLI